MKPTPLQIETIPVPIPSLPDALEDTRLTLFADLHMNGRSIAPQHRQALEHVARERPDVICILGDVIDNNTVHVPALAPYLRDVASVAPTVAVLGNNDCFGPKNLETLRETYDGCGITLLENEARTLPIGGASLEITGLEDPAVSAKGLRRERPDRDSAPRLSFSEAVAPRPQTPSVSVVMLHRPELAMQYALAKPTLILAGHAHGGQIRLPFLGGLYAPGQGIFPRWTSGLYPMGESRLLVSRGLGNHGSTLRFGNPFHLPIAVLQKKN